MAVAVAGDQRCLGRFRRHTEGGCAGKGRGLHIVGLEGQGRQRLGAQEPEHQDAAEVGETQPVALETAEHRIGSVADLLAAGLGQGLDGRELEGRRVVREGDGRFGRVGGIGGAGRNGETGGAVGIDGGHRTDGLHAFAVDGQDGVIGAPGELDDIPRKGGTGIDRCIGKHGGHFDHPAFAAGGNGGFGFKDIAGEGQGKESGQVQFLHGSSSYMKKSSSVMSNGSIWSFSPLLQSPASSARSRNLAVGAA